MLPSLILHGIGGWKEGIVYGPQQNQLFTESSGMNHYYWLMQDGQENVTDVVGDSNYDSANISNHIVYDAFGNILSQSDPTYQPRFGFTGYQYDGNTRLYYANARYYDANSGTFLVQDPKGFAAGQSNLYEYVGNNPLD